MGQSKLAYQLVAGIVSQPKRKLVEHEGTFEQLLEAVWFKEAWIKEVACFENSSQCISSPVGGKIPSLQ